jgi:hypothetical protein
MKNMIISSITSRQYEDIAGYAENETFHYEDLVATRHANHPEYGDVILVSSFNGSYLMIHHPDICKSETDRIETGKHLQH